MARVPKLKPKHTDKGWKVEVPAQLTENARRMRRFFSTREEAEGFIGKVKVSDFSPGFGPMSIMGN